MLSVDRRSLQNFDWVLTGLFTLILIVGFVNLASSTHTDAGLSDAMRRQLVSLGLGLVALVVVVVIDYRQYERLAIPVYVGSLALLVLTLVIAPMTRGSQSWLLEGRLQPAELAKIGMVLMLSRYFHRNPAGEARGLLDLVRPALIIGLPVALILLQRDMGVALLTLLVGSTYLALVRLPKRAWAGVVLLGVAALACLWLFVFQPYQRERILDVVNPGRDPLSSGYQVNQSRIAVGSGGLFGKGYMEGTQTQLRFLPTQHTDFAFSVWAEEWGFLGSLGVLATYAALMVWGLIIARNAKDGFGSMLAIGVVGMFFWPQILNVGMVLGVLPVIGVPLPLISYGGSALVVNLVAIGLLLNVSVRRWVF